MSALLRELDGARRLRRAPNLDIRPLPDGYVVYQPARDRVHYLNATAALLLELCDGSPRIADLADLLATAYGVDDVPAGEVVRCLHLLLAEELLA